MDEFPGNSKKASEQKQKPEKKIEKVVVGEVVERKKPLGRRFKDIFFGGEFKNATRYVAAEVLLPALRNLVVDSTTKGVERVIYGESMNTRRRPTNYGSKVQYNSPVRRDPRDRPVYLPDQPPHSVSRQDKGEIVLQSREEAALVLERLMDIIEMYDVASLADLYDLLGLPSSHVDNKWGWSSLNHVDIRQVRDGYIIDLPSTEAI